MGQIHVLATNLSVSGDVCQCPKRHQAVQIKKSGNLYGYENVGEKEYWWSEAHSQGEKEDLVNCGYETQWLISPQYNKVSKVFSEGLAGVEINGKVGYIDKKNRFVIAPQFEPMEKLQGFKYGLSAVKTGGKFGFIDKLGHIVIPAIFDYAENFDKDYLAVVKMKGKFGAIDLRGDTVVPCHHITEETMKLLPIKNKEYRTAAKQAKTRFDDGYYNDFLKNVRAVAEKIDERIHGEEYTIAEYPTNLKTVTKDTLAGLAIEGDTALVLPIEYTEIKNIGDGLFEITKSYNNGLQHKHGIADAFGRILLPCNFSEIRFQKSERMFFPDKHFNKGNGKAPRGCIGLYDMQGGIVLPCVFDEVSFFSDGLADVRIDSIRGKVDVNGLISDDYLNQLLGAANENSEYYLHRLQILRPTCASVYNNLAIIYLNIGENRDGMRLLKLAHKLAPNNKDIANNLDAAKDARRERRYNRWMKGLSIAGTIIGVAATTYAAATGQSYTATNSLGDTGAITATTSDDALSGKSTTSGGKTENASTNKKMSGADTFNKNTDRNTYMSFSNQLSKMNTYYERDYNDKQRKYIQSQMKRLREKWESRGESFSYSDWEKWNGKKI